MSGQAAQSQTERLGMLKPERDGLPLVRPPSRVQRGAPPIGRAARTALARQAWSDTAWGCARACSPPSGDRPVTTTQAPRPRQAQPGLQPGPGRPASDQRDLARQVGGASGRLARLRAHWTGIRNGPRISVIATGSGVTTTSLGHPCPGTAFRPQRRRAAGERDHGRGPHPDDIRAAAAQMGLFGYALPAGCGGLGLDLRQDVELAMEFGYTTLALRSMFGTNNGIAGQVLVDFGTEEQKKQWLERSPPATSSPRSRSPNPGPGSDPAGTAHPAVRDGERLGPGRGRSASSPTPRSRTCSWCSPAREPGPDGPGIAVFLVPADARRASASAPRTPRWARREPGPPTSSSTRSGSAECRARRRHRGDRLPGGHDVAGPRPRPHRRARGRLRPARPGRIGGLRRDQHARRDPHRGAPARAGDAGRPVHRRRRGPRAGPRGRRG